MIAAVVGLALASGVFQPAVDSSRYKAVISFSTSTGRGAAAAVQGATVTGYLTLIEHDTTGGKMAEFRIDSLLQAPGKDIPPKYNVDPKLATGLVYRAKIVNGVPVGGFQLSAPNVHAKLLSTGLDNLYPGFKQTIKSGDTWADTTMVATVTPVVQNTTISVWKITSLLDGQIVADAVTSGTQLSQGKTADNKEQEIKGTMSGKRHLVGPMNGPMMSATISSTQPLTSTTGTAAPISIIGKTTMTITRIP